ncbi:MAG TPA: hypothetical protein VK815_18115 [Candidatus Acidoferrales bacterium]|nr:hypothetical protein [Candidatus Acidoferrales bacterium]
MEKISHGIQEGRFQWVWDLNLGDNRRRELRFLALEVFRPEITKSFTLEDAIRVVLGETRQSFVSGDIVRRFRISRVSLSRLHRGGYLVGTISGGGFTTTRPALETFLRQRWIGGGQ